MFDDTVTKLESVLHTLADDSVQSSILYPVIADPPLFAGVIHDTVSRRSPATRLVPSGPLGSNCGIPVTIAGAP